MRGAPWAKGRSRVEPTARDREFWVRLALAAVDRLVVVVRREE